MDTRRRPVLRELRGRRCAACDLRTTHLGDVCLRCERLASIRRRGLGLAVGGGVAFAAGLLVTALRGLDTEPSALGLALAVLGAAAAYPGLYGLLYRRWPDMTQDDYVS